MSDNIYICFLAVRFQEICWLTQGNVIIPLKLAVWWEKQGVAPNFSHSVRTNGHLQEIGVSFPLLVFVVFSVLCFFCEHFVIMRLFCLPDGRGQAAGTGAGTGAKVVGGEEGWRSARGC